MGAPVIGLTGYEEQVSWGVWDVPGVLLPSAYVQSVAAAGGVPVVLPPVPEVIELVLPRLDGLVLSGGPTSGRGATAPRRWRRRRSPGSSGTPPSSASRRRRRRQACRFSGSAGVCSCSTWPAAAPCTSTCRTWSAPTSTHRRPGSTGGTRSP